MPLVEARTFRVRHYECDLLGDVHPANYLRYMQEVAFDASASGGYDLECYRAMGRLWLIRESDVEYVRPLRYGDTVWVSTWVADFQRVRSRRAYEFRLANSDELVARAFTDWVFWDTARGRPATIPSDMMACFFPEGLPDPAPLRLRFPSASPPAAGVFRSRRRVDWGDLDQAGHVNNAMYLTYLDDCSVRASAARGWPPEKLHAEGCRLVTQRNRIEYRQPAVLGDELELTTWQSEAESHSGTATRHHTISRVNDGTLLVQANTVWACADVHSGELVPIPQRMLDDLR